MCIQEDFCDGTTLTILEYNDKKTVLEDCPLHEKIIRFRYGKSRVAQGID